MGSEMCIRDSFHAVTWSPQAPNRYSDKERRRRICRLNEFKACDEVDNHDEDGDVLAVLRIDDIEKYQFNNPPSRNFELRQIAPHQD